MPIQMIAHFGMEHALNEYKLECDFTKEHIVEWAAGEIVDPKSFKTKEEFYELVQYKFEKCFDLTYRKVSAHNHREYRLKDEDSQRIYEERKQRKYSPIRDWDEDRQSLAQIDVR